MGLSIFLAKLLGIYMLIVAVLGIARRDQVQKLMKEIISSRGLLALTGIISLVLGLAIVLGHPIWELNWKGVITLIGVLAIIKGIMRLGFTEQVQKIASKITPRSYGIIMLVLVVLGAFLTYFGFTS